MKFCYIDESGTGNEPFAVMVGILVDAQRMHVTKSDWQTLLKTLSDILKKEVKEFHTRDFYRGNSVWRGLDGAMRTQIISAVLSWFKDRKHQVIFSGIEKKPYLKDKTSNPKIKDLKSIWCFMGLHLMLTVQKHMQNEQRNKGNTVFIFDNEMREQTRFAELVTNPPDWSDDYYGKKKGASSLDQVVDVPYYADSEDVHLIQIADLMAYLLRIYTEIKEKIRSETYPEEEKRLDTWIEQIGSFSLPVSTRYPARSRNQATEIFYKYAPDSLRRIGR